MMHPLHLEILTLIKQHSGKPTQHTFLDSYLGNDRPRYAINAPTMRRIARDWMRGHRTLSAADFQKMITSMIHGQSSTEKCMAGVMLDVSTLAQRKFDPTAFDGWLDNLTGWAEIDSVCTGAYTVTEIPTQWTTWKRLLVRFSKSSNINKRRASIVLLCSPLRRMEDPRLLALAIENVNRLKAEKEILITKAVSWVLRSAVPKHKKAVEKYVRANRGSLPKIAVRETMTKLKTGRKGG